MKLSSLKVFPFVQQASPFQNWHMRIHCIHCGWSIPCLFPGLWEQRPEAHLRRPDHTIFWSAPCLLLPPQTHPSLYPWSHPALPHIFISGTEVSLLTHPNLGQSYFFLQDMESLCLAPLLLSVSFQISWPKADHTPSFSRTHSLSIFHVLGSQRLLKDNENPSTAILSCKEFARFAGTENYRNVLLVLCGLESLEGQGSTGNTDMWK